MQGGIVIRAEHGVVRMNAMAEQGGVDLARLDFDGVGPACQGAGIAFARTRGGNPGQVLGDFQKLVQEHHSQAPVAVQFLPELLIGALGVGGKAVEACLDRLAGLQNYKEFLENSKEKLEDVQTTFETLQDLKKIFLDSYDPKDSIENMSAKDILSKGFFDRLSEKLMGSDPPTERSKAEDALTVYEKMLEQQKDNDFLQQGRLDRISQTVVGRLKDKAAEQLKETAEDIAKTVAGEAFAVVGIVNHALTSFQKGAEKEVFVGLAAAYNRQRDAIMQSNPNLSPEEAHKRTVRQIQDDPYQDNPNTGFVKFGNVLANGDCKDAGNALCIDNRVFWTAMGKTYEHNSKVK